MKSVKAAPGESIRDFEARAEDVTELIEDTF